MSPRQTRYAKQAASLCCAAGAGALLFSIRVATTIFQELPTDRALAGRIAGRAFTSAYAIAAAAAVVTIVVVFATRSARSRIDPGLAIALLAAGLVELFWVAPAIVRHGAGWPGSFASLHAVGGGLHVLLIVLALALAWRLLDGSDAGVVAELPVDQRF